ncbi:MAG: hypothetical protein SAJ11_19475, partial [Jaaginema sp. PMC 1078.18]|nr:hypothetical protein [Jaaginema sp. PMC 1078.18]
MQPSDRDATVFFSNSQLPAKSLLDWLELRENQQYPVSDRPFEKLLQAFPVPMTIARVADSHILYTNKYFD